MFIVNKRATSSGIFPKRTTISGALPFVNLKFYNLHSYF
jgi:hypothetical protein